MEQFVLICTLAIAFIGGFLGSLMAINAKYPTTWGFFWKKSRLLYYQSAVHGALSALIFFFLFAIMNVQISFGEASLQNYYAYALIVGLASKPLYNYEFFSFSLGSETKKFSILNLIPILKNFDDDLELDQYQFIIDVTEKRCAKYPNFDEVKLKILKAIPDTTIGKAFKADVESGKYKECWEIMFYYAKNFGHGLLDRAFPLS